MCARLFVTVEQNPLDLMSSFLGFVRLQLRVASLRTLCTYVFHVVVCVLCSPVEPVYNHIFKFRSIESWL